MRKSVAGALLGCVAGGLILLADLLFSRTGANPLEVIELKTYDWRLAHTARPETARKDIVLVEIDESSLRDLQPNLGRWPWPRVAHSMLVDFLARGPARVIAYDVDFPEADSRIGFALGGSTWSGAESDKAFADSVKAAGTVILLADASFDGELASPAAISDAGYRLDVPGILERRSLVPPFPALAAAASALGHNLFVLDLDGPIRHALPFVRSHHRVLPSLGVAAALRVAGIRPSDVRLDGDLLHFGDRIQQLSEVRVKSSDGVISYLWGLIRFRGPALSDDLKSTTYPTYRFFDLLDAENHLIEGAKPGVDPSVFRDKIVFVGVTASGLHDVFETPFSHGKMPGISIHAAIADEVLSGRFLDELRPVRATTVVGSALLVGLVATAVPVWWATAITIGFLALVGSFATHFFANGHWFNVTQPMLASALALFGGVGYQYFVEGREKRKMKRLFGRYVSKDVYDHLVANPALARLGGQRREMTVLFSDIRGFTTVSERGQPEEIVGTLNEYFTRMVDIVFARKGTLDKFVGDMVMALFGAPLDDAQHADHAVEAALDMIEALGELNALWRAEGRPELDIGIGINTGAMIAGNIGSDAIMSYTVIGDAVNLGSRLESLNKDYGTRIIISEATRARLAGSYALKPLGDVIVKGKTQPVAIFELVGRAPALAGHGAQA